MYSIFIRFLSGKAVMFVCEQIRNVRYRLKLSQERFGKKIGISAKSISAYETGRCVPSIKILKHIADEYNVNFMEFPSENRNDLREKISQLENSFLQLKTLLAQTFSSERIV